MKWLEKNYDKVILLAVGVIAIAVALTLIRSSTGFSQRFDREQPSRGTELAETGIEDIRRAESLLEEPFRWKSPEIGGRPIRLNTSVTVIERANPSGDGNVTIDMESPSSPMLRPPMTNEWLLENELDFLRSDVGELDPDGDGFSNLEEFEGGTDPRDPESHPPFTDKLFVSERIAHPYVVVYQTGTPPALQIRRVEPDTTSYFGDIGGKFFRDDQRFVVRGFEEKKDPQAPPGQQDVSEIEVEDTVNGETFELIRGQPVDRGDASAVFTYVLFGQEEIRVRERQEFELPNDPSTSYKLIDINESRALISPLDSDGNETGAIQIPRR